VSESPAPEHSPRAHHHLTSSQEDYLKALYHLGGVSARIRTNVLARRLQVSAASATEMLGRLAVQGLVSHDRYRGAMLTAEGTAVALEMVRHHRLLEVYLVQKLGYTWDEVHDEAEHLEHAISERMEARMFEILGRPNVDCHGDPIPSQDGNVTPSKHRTLLEASARERLRVRRVSDHDAVKLRALSRLGLRLGVEFEVLQESTHEGPIVLRVAGRRRQVPIGLARVVFVE